MARERWRDWVADLLDLPGDVVLDMCRVVLIGDRRMMVENHRGLVEYTPERVTLHVPHGQLCITGRDLMIAAVSQDAVTVLGKVEGLRFLE